MKYQMMLLCLNITEKATFGLCNASLWLGCINQCGVTAQVAKQNVLFFSFCIIIQELEETEYLGIKTLQFKNDYKGFVMASLE